MKISPVNINFTRLNFKGQNKPVTLGYDDDISGLRRDYIRRHYEETNLPNVDIFEREGRLEKRELDKLISKLTQSKTTFVDDEKIRKLHLTNCGPIGNNSYRGAMLNAYDMYKMPGLKEAGIKQIVDLTSNNYVKYSCMKNKIKYFTPVEIDYDSPVFRDEEDVKQESLVMHRDVQGLGEKETEELMKRDVKNWKQDARKFIDGFVEFIQTMQKGNTYIGCYMGTDTTDSYVFFNGLFNPKFENFNLSHLIETSRGTSIYDARKLYEHLTDNDKKKMGWDKDFEEKFLNNLDMYDEYFNY